MVPLAEESGGCPPACPGFFQALHRHQLAELLPVGSAVLGPDASKLVT